MKVADLPARFRGRVTEADDGCWLWTGKTHLEGYGVLRIDGRDTLAHRAAYEALIGPIADGLVIDHLCRCRACVNPAHMEPVTIGENVRRGEPATKTHCARGHEFSPENTQVTAKGHRRCRACHRAHQARYRAAAGASA